jgi:hypothetical protein
MGGAASWKMRLWRDFKPLFWIATGTPIKLGANPLNYPPSLEKEGCQCGRLLSARDQPQLMFTSGPFGRGAANFQNQRRIPPKNAKALTLPALERLRIPNPSPSLT